ncbi:hypothetical protein BGZ99_006987 [Dissophora globulifera]|uniref:Uncharacterized protein n=1 Tax=Dissophora globulifera TaxID=979702 RepID=A0A9P6RS63_9FUNG|nr:hypothetical protein BGZ99_006987 [Dissophora globulifera]
MSTLSFRCPIWACKTPPIMTDWLTVTLKRPAFRNERDHTKVSLVSRWEGRTIDVIWDLQSDAEVDECFVEGLQRDDTFQIKGHMLVKTVLLRDQQIPQRIAITITALRDVPKRPPLKGDRLPIKRTAQDMDEYEDDVMPWILRAERDAAIIGNRIRTRTAEGHAAAIQELEERLTSLTGLTKRCRISPSHRQDHRLAEPSMTPPVVPHYSPWRPVAFKQHVSRTESSLAKHIESCQDEDHNASEEEKKEEKVIAKSRPGSEDQATNDATSMEKVHKEVVKVLNETISSVEVIDAVDTRADEPEVGDEKGTDICSRQIAGSVRGLETKNGVNFSEELAEDAKDSKDSTKAAEQDQQSPASQPDDRPNEKV